MKLLENVRGKHSSNETIATVMKMGKVGQTFRPSICLFPSYNHVCLTNDPII